MKRKIAIIGGIVVVVGLLAGFGWHFFGDRISGGNKAGDDVVYVSTVSSLTETASGTQNRYAGVVEPQQTVEVKLESNRVVKEVKVTVGQEIAVGTPLFEYDASASQDDLEQAQLELEQLKNDLLSLQDQLATLESEKKTATQDNQLSYTIQIQQSKMDIKKNEYSQKSKAKEIEKLQSAAVNTIITSEIAGVIKSIDTSKLDESSAGSPDDLDMMNSGSGDGESSAFITILGTGTYRVKGIVNETNVSSIIEGSPVIIRSRVDEEQIWQGTMGNVDRENPTNSSSGGGGGMMMYGYGGYSSSSSEEAQTSSSSYPFYVELGDASGLMLGQHVYIEMDYGQDEVKDGLWLDSFYIVDVDTDPYVWMASDKDRLMKQPVELGDYDANLDKYEIVKGLEKEDCIAYPTSALEEGLPTEINDGAQIPYTGGEEELPQEGGDLENPEEGMPMDGEALDEDPMINEGPGSDVDLSEQDMENISDSPDGPFAEDMIVQEDVQEGVAPE